MEGRLFLIRQLGEQPLVRLDRPLLIGLRLMLTIFRSEGAATPSAGRGGERRPSDGQHLPRLARGSSLIANSSILLSRMCSERASELYDFRVRICHNPQ